MNPKRLFQIFVLLTLLFSPFGINQQVPVSASSVDQPTVSMSVSPSSINIGGSATVTVRLDNVPAEGYTSLELTCSYYPSLVDPGDLLVGNLFGSDPAVAVKGPQYDRFIVAISGSGGNKATSSGTVMSFQVTGLQAGQSPMECQARASKGDNVLTTIASTGNNVMVLTPTPTSTTGFCDSAEFVADINVPPGTVVAPGAQFTKTWRLKNIGSCAWTTSYQMVFFSGEQMGAPVSVSFPVNVSPGQTIDLSLNMTAPAVAGSYRGNWMFKNTYGTLFGAGTQANEPWFVDILVSGASVTPSLTASQTPSPTLETNTLTASPSPTGTISLTPGTPTASQSPTPSITPGGPIVTPVPGVVYDFVAGMCSAVWISGAGQLPCPGIDGSPNGFVFKLDHPMLENGTTNTPPGLLTFPQDTPNGYIQGFYPPFHVQNGDRLRSILSCEFGATGCYVAFRLDYQIGADPVRTLFGPFLERYDGFNYTADVDLSSLADKDVKFILTVLSSGNAAGDRALWVGPVIYRQGGSSTATATTESSLTPTAEVSPTHTLTLTSTVEGGSVTPTESTSTPMPGTGTLNGKALASKVVTINVYNADNVLVGTGSVSADGTFEFSAASGINSVIASASGFLSAQRSVTVTDGSTLTLPPVTLIAGDIDNNDVIDQFDALTIGMNYNRAAPAEADLNNDGIINVLDLELLARNYRTSGPITWE